MYPRNTRTLVFIALLIFVIAFLVFLLLINRQRQGSKQPTGIPNYSPLPTATQPSSLTQSINSQKLTDQEQAFPEGAPLPSTSNTSNTFGGLVVITDPSEARIMIDPIPENQEAEAPATSTPKIIPIKVTPFKISSIPSGKHTLRVFKQDYQEQSIDLEVVAGNVTRINLKLTPLK